MAAPRGRALAALLLAAGVAWTQAGARASGGPGPSLAIEHAGRWRTWWRAGEAPERWAGPAPVVTAALAWRPLADGIAWAELRLAGEAPAWRVRLIVVRVDPSRARLSLEQTSEPGHGAPAWSVARAPADAIVALNAGQFTESLPWGWVVIDGREHQAPGRGPLATAVVLDRAGRVRWIAADSVAVGRPGVVTAFESWPALLRDDGTVPLPLRVPGFGVDLAHRDARLALGQSRDGTLLIALTRFDGLGETAGAVPTGLTSAEMAAVMGALGARDAVMLDGGISAQLALRAARGGWHRTWPGWRRVPMGLVVRSGRP